MLGLDRGRLAAQHRDRLYEPFSPPAARSAAYTAKPLVPGTRAAPLCKKMRGKSAHFSNRVGHFRPLIKDGRRFPDSVNVCAVFRFAKGPMMSRPLPLVKALRLRTPEDLQRLGPPPESASRSRILRRTAKKRSFAKTDGCRKIRCAPKTDSDAAKR